MEASTRSIVTGLGEAGKRQKGGAQGVLTAVKLFHMHRTNRHSFKFIRTHKVQTTKRDPYENYGLQFIKCIYTGPSIVTDVPY